jgi:hypothetical protein
MGNLVWVRLKLMVAAHHVEGGNVYVEHQDAGATLLEG